MKRQLNRQETSTTSADHVAVHCIKFLKTRIPDNLPPESMLATAKRTRVGEDNDYVGLTAEAGALATAWVAGSLKSELDCVGIPQLEAFWHFVAHAYELAPKPGDFIKALLEARVLDTKTLLPLVSASFPTDALLFDLGESLVDAFVAWTVRCEEECCWFSGGPGSQVVDGTGAEAFGAGVRVDGGTGKADAWSPQQITALGRVLGLGMTVWSDDDAWMYVKMFRGRFDPGLVFVGRTLLHWACSREMSKTALHLVATYGEATLPAYVDPKKNTALGWTCYNHLFPVAHVLLDTFDDVGVNQVDAFGMTPFLRACGVSEPLALAMMRKLGSVLDVSIVAPDGNTALTLACKAGHVDLAEALVKTFGRATRPTHKNSVGDVPFSIALEKGWYELGVTLLELGGRDCAAHDPTGLLHTCIWGSRKREYHALAEGLAVQLVETHGSDIQLNKFLRPDEYSEVSVPLLMCACARGWTRLATTLMATYDADALLPEYVNPSDRLTALMLACSRGKGELANALIDTFGARVQPRKVHPERGTALHQACSAGLGSTAMKFLEAFPDDVLFTVNQARDSILMSACRSRLPDVAVRLIRVYGAVVQLRPSSRSGWTALMVACQEGLEDVALLMLERFGVDASPAKETTDGETALSLAMERNPPLTRVVMALVKIL